jgi:replicative DNA helicase
MEHEKNCGRAHSQQFDCAPPCDIEAERAVLAAVLLEPRRIGDVTAALKPIDFADRAHRTLFTAMLSLQQRGLPADATLVVGELCDRGQYNVEDGVSTATLVDLFQLFPLVRHLP